MNHKFALLQVGFTYAYFVTSVAVGSYPTFSPLPFTGGYFLQHFPKLTFSRCYLALFPWSPDFPLCIIHSSCMINSRLYYRIYNRHINLFSSNQVCDPCRISITFFHLIEFLSFLIFFLIPALHIYIYRLKPRLFQAFLNFR